MAPSTNWSVLAASRTIFLFICWAIVFALPGWGQNLLGRRISISATNTRLDRVLIQIEEKGHFYFAYRDGIFDSDSLVSFSCQEKPVKWILDQLFDHQLDFRVVGNHIVLTPIPIAPIKKEKALWTISGYVINSRNGLPIPGATLYEPSQQFSGPSDGAGQFKLTIPPGERELTLAVRKIGFKDTVVVLKTKPDLAITVGMEPEIPILTTIPSQEIPPLMRLDPVETLPVIEFLIPDKQKKLVLNIHRPVANIPFQLSLVPGLSTNNLLTGGMENIISVNIIGGYAYSLRGFEAGGAFNILRDNMKGFQAAGAMNVVGGDMRGFQAAGAINRVSGSGSGFQASGGINLIKGNMKGFQAAGGLNNVAGEFRGIQASGGANIVKGPFSGFQAAGGLNINNDLFNGFQASGGINLQKGAFSGIQVGSILNWQQSPGRGFMVSGVVNHSSSTFKGAQISGVLNYGKKVQGLQIGLINIADTLNGAALGLLSFSRVGYRAMEVSVSDFSSYQFALKTGTHSLYNIYLLGWQPMGSPYFSGGLGLGTRIFGKRKVTLSFEGITEWIYRDGFNRPEANFRYTFHPSLGIRLGHLELAAGPTGNLWVTQTQLANGGYYQISNQVPKWSYDNGTTYLGGWIGMKANIRLWNYKNDKN